MSGPPFFHPFYSKVVLTIEAIAEWLTDMEDVGGITSENVQDLFLDLLQFIFHFHNDALHIRLVGL